MDSGRSTRLLFALLLAVFSGFVATAILLVAQTTIGRHFWAWGEGRVRASQQAGDEIIKGLAAYHADKGKYPNEIDELVPKYLIAIPRPRAGDKKWRYRTTGDDAGFELSFAFDDGEYPICCYYSEDAKWHVDE
jgi:hypothetical protein